MSNKFRKIYNSMGYKKYRTSQQIIFLAEILVSQSINYAGDLKVPLEITSSGLGVVFLASLVLPRKFDIKDGKKIKEQYNEFLKEYVKLNDTFDFNNPVEVYTMYDYMLHKGYLSNDKHFEWYEDRTRDLYSVQGATVFTGYAVCRHTSAMLRDILKEKGIMANRLNVYINANNLTNINLIAKAFGNHTITYACSDGNSYFLDPTNSIIWQRDNNKLVSDKTKFKLKFTPSPRQYLKLKDVLKNPTLNKEESDKISNKTLEICDDNKDIFEKFYNDNKDMYEDVASKVYMLKKN